MSPIVTLPDPQHEPSGLHAPSGVPRVAEAAGAGEGSDRGVDRARARIGAVVVAHTVVDYVSFMPIALMPLLVTRLELTTGQKALLLGMSSVCSGAVQPLAAWIEDRLNTRALSMAGMALAGATLPFLGRVGSFEGLMLLWALGAAGVGAFHPGCAAAVGRLAGSKRTLGAAVFFVFGMLGGILGNITTPTVVEWFARPGGRDGPADYSRGLHGLVWFVLPTALTLAGVVWAIARVSHGVSKGVSQGVSAGVGPDPSAATSGAGGAGCAEPATVRDRWGVVWVLYVGNVLRFTVNTALVYLFVEWSTARARTLAGTTGLTEAQAASASVVNGGLQAAMQVGMGMLGLAFGFVLARRHEKAAFVAVPMLGALAIAGMPLIDPVSASASWWALAVSVAAGAGFGGLVPASLSLAQRMLPHRTSLASGMMLGGAWAFAVVGPSGARAIVDAGGLAWGFWVTAIVLALAGVVSVALPRTCEDPV
jgi:MFS family permease